MSDLLQILPSFPRGPFAKIVNAVEQQTISTTDLLALHPADLAKQTNVPLLDLKRFIAAVQASLSDDFTPDFEFLSAEDETASSSPVQLISTLDDELDAALGGGVPVGCITEFTGESGAGKTQFLLSLCLAVQLSSPRGLGKKALYISTESSLATRRLAQMLASNPILQDLEDGEKPSLDNILSTVTPDLESQDHILEYQVPVLVERHNVGLVILDSVAANYRAEFEHQGSRGSIMAARSAQLVKLGALLRDLARNHNLAVVVANQVADRFDSSNSSIMLRHMPPRSSMAPPESPLSTRSNAMPPPPTWSSTPSSSMPVPPSEEELVPPTLHLNHQQRWFTGWGDEPHSSYSLKTPSLGLVWSTQISCRIALFKRPVYGRPRRVGAPVMAGDVGDEGDMAPTLKSWRRWMKIIFAPHVQASGQGVTDATEFEVTMGGLKTVHKLVKTA